MAGFLGVLPQTLTPMEAFVGSVTKAVPQYAEIAQNQQKIGILQQHEALLDRGQKLETLKTIGNYKPNVRQQFGPALLRIGGLDADPAVVDGFSKIVASDQQLWNQAVQAVATAPDDPYVHSYLQAALATGDPLQVAQALQHAATVGAEREKAKAINQLGQARLQALTEHRNVMEDQGQQRVDIAQQRAGISQQNANTHAGNLEERRKGKTPPQGSTPTITPPPPGTFEAPPKTDTGLGIVERLGSILGGGWDFVKGAWNSAP